MLQYKLRTLLLVTLLVALATWLVFVLPDPAGVLALVAITATTPGLLAAGIVYFRGARQAFCIGAVPVQASVLLFLSGFGFSFPYQFPNYLPSQPDPVPSFKLWLAGAMMVTILAGLGAVLIRYLALSEAKSSDANKHAW
jgi:hypothetical protein